MIMCIYNITKLIRLKGGVICASSSQASKRFSSVSYHFIMMYVFIKKICTNLVSLLKTFIHIFTHLTIAHSIYVNKRDTHTETSRANIIFLTRNQTFKIPASTRKHQHVVKSIKMQAQAKMHNILGKRCKTHIYQSMVYTRNRGYLSSL